jgi:class 3 adenylate cyclase
VVVEPLPEEPRVPEVRVSDAERDRLVEVLRRHCTDGLLTLDEFSERVGLVYGARTRGELERVTVDLPATTPERLPDEKRRKADRWVIAIMSGATRRGRWRPDERTTALAIMGGCVLDLRAAEIDGPVVDINAIAIMGGIDIIVPEGIEVELSGTAIMGGKEARVKDVPRLPGTPVVRVQAFAFWGGVTVRSKPSRSAEKEAKRAKEREKGQREKALRQPMVPPLAPPRSRAPRPAATDDEASLEAVATAVQVERPGLLLDVPADGTVTILFSDIEDFTSLTERLGDLRAQEILRAHNELVRAQIAAHGGQEVKSQGDSFMIAFAGARRGLRCAVALQRALTDYAEKHPDAPLRVRMGLHTGEAIREADDLFGRSVIMAARIAGRARGGEILVSSLLRELADSSGEFSFEGPKSVTLKGLAGEHVVYAVDWQDDEISPLVG